MQLSTVMIRAGLGLKAAKSQHIANAVKQVFAHQYREEHGGSMFFLHPFQLPDAEANI